MIVLHYYKSTIDGVMTSMIDLFFNLRRALQNEWTVKMEIICPELYLMDFEDFYNVPLEETQWYEYVEDRGLEVKPYDHDEDLIKRGFRCAKNELTSSVPFLLYNRNFGDFNLLHSIVQDKQKFKDDKIICSARLLYEILMGADVELECEKLIVVDSLDTYKSKIGMFPDFDDLFDTMFKNTHVIQFSNPATMRESRYDQREYYHKFSYRRLDALKKSGHLKDTLDFKRTRSEKGDIGDGNYFENIGKQLFEHLWFKKQVNYHSDGIYTKDGMWYYMNLFGLDGFNNYGNLRISRADLMNHFFMKSNDELLRESRS